jgi:preprotein translocase subunit SecF
LRAATPNDRRQRTLQRSCLALEVARQASYGGSTLVGVDAVSDALLFVICMLVALALVVALVFQWRDDHEWLNRHEH